MNLQFGDAEPHGPPEPFAGILWKQALMSGSYERGELELATHHAADDGSGHLAQVFLTWFSDSQWASGDKRKAGSIDMCANELVLDLDYGCETKFSLRSVGPWQACTLLGAVGDNVFNFQTDGLGHPRDVWVRAFEAHIAYARYVQHDSTTPIDLNLLGIDGESLDAAGIGSVSLGHMNPEPMTFGRQGVSATACRDELSKPFSPFVLLPPPSPSPLPFDHSDPNEFANFGLEENGHSNCFSPFVLLPPPSASAMLNSDPAGPASLPTEEVSPAYGAPTGLNYSPEGYMDFAPDTDENWAWNHAALLRTVGLGSPRSAEGSLGPIADKVRSLHELVRGSAAVLVAHLVAGKGVDVDGTHILNVNIELSMQDYYIPNDWYTRVNEIICAGGAAGFVRNHSLVCMDNKLTVEASLSTGGDSALDAFIQAQRFDRACWIGDSTPFTVSSNVDVGDSAELIGTQQDQTRRVRIDVSKDIWFEQLFRVLYTCNDVYIEFTGAEEDSD